MDIVPAPLKVPHTPTLKPDTQTYKLKPLCSKIEGYYMAVMHAMLLMLAIDKRLPGTMPVGPYLLDRYPMVMKVFMVLAFYLPLSIFIALDAYIFTMVTMDYLGNVLLVLDTLFTNPSMLGDAIVEFIQSFFRIIFILAQNPQIIVDAIIDVIVVVASLVLVIRAKAMKECPSVVIEITNMLKPCYSCNEVTFVLFLDGVLLMLWEFIMWVWNDIQVMFNIVIGLYATLANPLTAVDKSFGWECKFMGYILFDVEKFLPIILVPVELFLRNLPALILVALNAYYFAMVLRVVWTNYFVAPILFRILSILFLDGIIFSSWNYIVEIWNVVYYAFGFCATLIGYLLNPVLVYNWATHTQVVKLQPGNVDGILAVVKFVGDLSLPLLFLALNVYSFIRVIQVAQCKN